MFKRQSNTFRVLIADENPSMHREFKKILAFNAAPAHSSKPAKAAFKIDSVESGAQAIKLVEKSLRDDAPFALLFVDMQMPLGTHSIHMIKKIWQLDKNIQVIICSSTDLAWDDITREFGVADNLMMIQKPFDQTELRQLAYVLARKWEFMQVHIMHQKLLEGQLEQTEKEYHHAITHDALTNLPNRLLLVDRINHAISHAGHTKNIFALFQLNIDRFALINDTLGRKTGDQLLQGIASRLGMLCEAWDATLARLNGDEFVIVLEHVRNDEQVTFFVEKILDAVKAPFILGNQEFVVTACVGAALYPKDGGDAEKLLKNINIALHKAKERALDGFQFYSADMTTHSLERLKLENQLRKAITLNQFLLYYQPQFDLMTGEFTGVEALVRWRHPEKGIVAPAEFLALLEESGLIVPLGEWILETACAQNVAWQKAGLKPFRVAVNLSMQQFMQTNFIDTVKHILYKTKLPPEFLELELTENMIIHYQDTIEKIHALKNMGIKIALDDFGSGFSSISYLKKLPLDRIKIDREFIKNIDIKSDDEAIIRAIIALAKSLNLRVLAEGIESIAQMNFLTSHECHEVQGSWLGHALPPEQLVEILQKAKVKMAELHAK